MALDIYSTYTLLMLIREVTENSRPSCGTGISRTNDATDLFQNHVRLGGIQRRRQEAGTLVLPPARAASPVLRHGSYMERFEPPNICAQTPDHPGRCEARGFGEALLSNLDPDTRNGCC